MSRSIFWRVVLKDLYLSRWLALLSMSIGILALALFRLGSAGLYAAMVLGMSALLLQGIFLCMNFIVMERKERALLFTLSLPISSLQYSEAKALSIGAAYLLPWIVLGAVGLVLIAFTPALSGGVIPTAVLWWTFLLDLFCLLLGVSLVSQSEIWPQVMLVSTSLSISFFIYFTGHVRSIAATMHGPVAVWSPAAIEILAVELATPIAILALTFLLLARRRDFI